MKTLRFGVAYDFRNPAHSGIKNTEFYAAILEQVAWLDSIGLDLVWFTEHHFMEDGYLPSWIPVAGAMAANTDRIRFSTNICLMPFNNPLRLAEDLAVLDNISGGRVEIGLGQGYAPHEFRGFGLPIKQRVSYTEEGVKVLQRCFSGERFSFNGKRYIFENVEIFPRFVQENGTPIFMAAMSKPGAKRAAAFGVNLLPQGPRTKALDPWINELKKLGRRKDEYRVGIIRPCLVTENPDRDWPKIREAERYRIKVYLKLSSESGGEGLAQANDPNVIPQTWIVGGVSDCVNELSKFIKNFGITAIVTWGCPPGLHPSYMNESLEKFVKQVVPALRKIFS